MVLIKSMNYSGVYIKYKTEAGGKYSEDESTEKNEKN